MVKRVVQYVRALDLRWAFANHYDADVAMGNPELQATDGTMLELLMDSGSGRHFRKVGSENQIRTWLQQGSMYTVSHFSCAKQIAYV